MKTIKIVSAHVSKPTSVRFENKYEFNCAEEAEKIVNILFTIIPSGVFEEVQKFLEYYSENEPDDGDIDGLYPSEIAKQYFEKRIAETTRD